MIVRPARRVGRRPLGIESLTDRQRQVLDAYIAHGDQRAIATQLGISPQSVKNHITAILDKLDCASSLQACVLYDRWRRSQGWPAVERRSGVERRQGERRAMRRAA